MRMSQWVGLGIGFGLAMASSAQTIAPGAPTDSRPPAATAKEPKSAADWFRRADELTNIRMPGSQPFHMKVKFHAYPGMDFTEPGKSPIMTGTEHMRSGGVRQSNGGERSALAVTTPSRCSTKFASFRRRQTMNPAAS